MDVSTYMQRPYNHIIKKISDESGTYYHATVLELEGCMSTGETFQEAYDGLLEAMEGWLETKIANGYAIPEPIGGDKFSGKFLVRLPKSLHQKLAIEAKQEGVSLNQYALYKLSM